MTDGDVLGKLVRDAVASALEDAQGQWMAQLKGGKWPFETSKNSELGLTQLSSKLDVLNDRVQALDTQSMLFADRRVVDDLQRIALSLEARMSRLEAKLDHLVTSHSQGVHDMQTIVSSDKQYLEERFSGLVERMSVLESSVEAEHETSIELFDLLLRKKSRAGGGRGRASSVSTGNISVDVLV